MVMRHRRLLSTACAALTAGLAASLTACSSGAGAAVERDHRQQQPVRRELAACPVPAGTRSRSTTSRPAAARSTWSTRRTARSTPRSRTPGPARSPRCSLDLGSGTYAFMCLFNDFNPQVGAKVTVGGHAKGTPAVLPVTYNETIPYAKKYQAYAEAGLKVLARPDGDARRRLPRAATWRRRSSDWLTAHLQYQTLGAAYGTFGDYDGEIDGRRERHRGHQPGLDRVLPPGVRAVARAVRQRARAGRRPARQRRERAARLVADAADPAVRRRPAHPRDPGERPRSSSSPGTTTTAAAPRSPPRSPTSRAPARCSPCCARCCVPRYPGLPAVYSGPRPAAVAAREGASPERDVGSRLGAPDVHEAGDRRGVRCGAAVTRPDRVDHRAEEHRQ